LPCFLLRSESRPSANLPTAGDWFSYPRTPRCPLPEPLANPPRLRPVHLFPALRLLPRLPRLPGSPPQGAPPVRPSGQLLRVPLPLPACPLLAVQPWLPPADSNLL